MFEFRFVYWMINKQFAENKTRPKWALTSFPGSGVTWTRQLIEGVTGWVNNQYEKGS